MLDWFLSIALKIADMGKFGCRQAIASLDLRTGDD
jgi:hypothetical protein